MEFRFLLNITSCMDLFSEAKTESGKRVNLLTTHEEKYTSWQHYGSVERAHSLTPAVNGRDGRNRRSRPFNYLDPVGKAPATSLLLEGGVTKLRGAV